MEGIIFPFFKASRLALGRTQPPIQWASGVISSGVKQLGHEADHSSLSSAKVKNVWSFTSTPPTVFTAWCLIKHRAHFAFYLVYGRRSNDDDPVVHTFPYRLTSCYLIFSTRFVQASLEVKITLFLILPTSIITNIVIITAYRHLIHGQVFGGYLKIILEMWLIRKYGSQYRYFNGMSIVSCLLFSSTLVTSFNSHLYNSCIP
jgi:hypothetical protein